jgi:hypothetical protein
MFVINTKPVNTTAFAKQDNIKIECSIWLPLLINIENPETLYLVVVGNYDLYKLKIRFKLQYLFYSAGDAPSWSE